MDQPFSLVKTWNPDSFQMEIFPLSKKEAKKEAFFYGIALENINLIPKLKGNPLFKNNQCDAEFENKRIEEFLKSQQKTQEGWKSSAKGSFGEDIFACHCEPREKGKSTHILVRTREAENFDWSEALRSHWGSVLKRLKKCEKGEVSIIDFSFLSASLQKYCLENVAALTETLFWDFPKYQKTDNSKTKEADKKPIPRIGVLAPKITPADFKKIVRRGQLWGKANNFVRTAAERAANDLTPGQYRKEAEEICKKHKWKTEFLSESELKKRNAGGFLAVARAWDGKGENGILRIENGKAAKSSKGTKNQSVCFVGKGLCFDTGGYNVKTGNYMWGMQKDMTGSAVALATFMMMATFEPKRHWVAYLALCDNLISPTAYKCNEVIQTAKGITIEVVNTDAEGRMVLSDTLFFASEEKPGLMIDFATLTGSAVYSLDTYRSMAFTNKPQLISKVTQAGDSSGERLWMHPIGGTWERNLKSDIADTKQCKVTGKADAIYAATFLNLFVNPEVKWVHVDLACAENPGGLGVVATETTGYGPRLAYELVQELAS